jgi:hypothetical protein
MCDLEWQASENVDCCLDELFASSVSMTNHQRDHPTRLRISRFQSAIGILELYKMPVGIALLVIFMVVSIALISRVFAGSFDGDRLASYVQSQGWELIDAKWSPFGKGWVGEKNDRIYNVRYRDREGNIHVATVKTSMLSGVYFTDDKIVERATETEPNVESLVSENERLKQRIADLESR